MSQHLIIDFINRISTFKPINGAKITNRKIKKYQGSNRDNNELPQLVAQETSAINQAQHALNNEQDQQNSEGEESSKRIDITI